MINLFPLITQEQRAQIEAQALVEEQGKFSYMIITELCLCCLGHSVSFACEVTNSVIVFTLEPCSNIYNFNQMHFYQGLSLGQ